MTVFAASAFSWRSRWSEALPSPALAAAFYYGRSQILIFLLAAVVGIASTLFRPALQAILPSLATDAGRS